MKLCQVMMFSLLWLSGCKDKAAIHKISGEAQGTTWHITYISENPGKHKSAIESILKELDLSLSTWVKSSIICRINRNEKDVLINSYFRDVFLKSMEVSDKTQGLFDITVGPLVNAWGFGPAKKLSINSLTIDSLRKLVGYRMLKLENDKVIKARPEINIDFNAIAQGYSVDVLAAYLDRHGVHNYLVELGGELIAKGSKNQDNWTVGIDRPDEVQGAERKLQAIVQLENRALATSGNYRKFYEEDGMKYAHIIDPRTGYPAKQNILSATVLADDAMSADAYATAFMVMGLDRAKEFLQENKDLKLDVFFVYAEDGKWKTFQSDGMKNLIKEVN
ncbi:FAD:protein FMN transferase [Daejeonella sp.]|uniref:FAD:protein FMN transferase n=1 Tax=Daejeonella sp. TaxID=2805397 RepID=UPI003983C76E